VIAPIAAALLALTFAGPVAADPIGKAQFPHVYVTTCDDPDAPAVPEQMAHAVPGWGLDWQPGDTPWLLKGYTVRLADGSIAGVAQAGMPGLVGNGKLFGPCTITWGDPDGIYIADAYFMQR
jgi:hypothetical protein